MIAALYDIHGNLPALEAVLDEIRREGVDRIVVGGDVFPGPMARESLELLVTLETPVAFIRGNGDRETIALRRGEASSVPEAYREVMRWGAQQLRPEQEQMIAGWPATLRVTGAMPGDVLFCHATPFNDTDIFTRATPDERLMPWFATVGAALVVCGHTHMQFDRTIGSTRVVNAGSVGMPFGEPAAHWLLLAPDVQLRRTAYDLEKAAERIRGTSYPQAEEFAATNILNPPSEERMLELFRQAADAQHAAP